MAINNVTSACDNAPLTPYQWRWHSLKNQFLFYIYTLYIIIIIVFIIMYTSPRYCCGFFDIVHRTIEPPCHPRWKFHWQLLYTYSPPTHAHARVYIHKHTAYSAHRCNIYYIWLYVLKIMISITLIMQKKKNLAKWNWFAERNIAQTIAFLKYFKWTIILYFTLCTAS